MKFIADNRASGAGGRSSSELCGPEPDKPIDATPAAVEAYSQEIIVSCLQVLRQKAVEYDGLDYLQVFQAESGSDLWFLEDGPGGAISAILSSDY